MKLLPLEKLGAREKPDNLVDFGIFLPWISADDGYRLYIKVIHEKDQFLQDIQPRVFELDHSVDQDYGDYWSTTVEIDPLSKLHKKSAWGTPGRYVYRYYLERPGLSPVDWIVDPFAREFGVGKLSAFTLGYKPHSWSEHETRWKTPKLEELILYELMIHEFGGSLEEAASRLDYLADLGVNCLEVMPVSNVSNVVDWGFLPIGYFGVDERFGKRRDMQRFVDLAHRKGLAVILDVVYGHTSSSFPYFYLYKQLGFEQNPFMGSFAKDYFGESTDFNRELTREFFFTVNSHWLDTYHVDGFRYDCVPNYWDGAMGKGYAFLVYETYRMVMAKKGLAGHWQRFFDHGDINFIQCAEQLEAPREILYETYSNCTWQNETLDAAQKVAKGDWGGLADLGNKLALKDYPEEVAVNGDVIRKTALQYIENHDHFRFVCNFGTLSSEGNDLLKEGDRSLWYKVQPYLIALFTSKGIPMLWQGQELGENYYVPDTGMGRVAMFRPMRWDYFYDPVGKSMISLVRRLAKVRRGPQFQRGGIRDFGNDSYLSRGILIFSRSYKDAFSVVALNFGDADQTVDLELPYSGDYLEELHGYDNLRNVVAGQKVALSVPSNYGRILTLHR